MQPATDMAMVTQPMQMSKPLPMQAARPRNFMPPVQASKSPIQGFLDIVTPTKNGEVEMVMPVTKPRNRQSKDSLIS